MRKTKAKLKRLTTHNVESGSAIGFVSEVGLLCESISEDDDNMFAVVINTLDQQCRTIDWGKKIQWILSNREWEANAIGERLTTIVPCCQCSTFFFSPFFRRKRKRAKEGSNCYWTWAWLASSYADVVVVFRAMRGEERHNERKRNLNIEEMEELTLILLKKLKRNKKEF